MKKQLAFMFALVTSAAACDRILHRPEPDAGATVVLLPPPFVAKTDGGLLVEDEDEVVTADGGTCPLAIHPSYCRLSCRNFQSRSATMHARRVARSVRAGTGVCGAFMVFAEEAQSDDGGSALAIVEYFDSKTNELVGAVDHREVASGTCGMYGTVPKCTPKITWATPHAKTGGGLGDPGF